MPKMILEIHLHIAAQSGNNEAVRKLLRSENPDIMEEFLDNSLKSKCLTTDDKFKITFKYHFLRPLRMRREKNL